MYTTFSPETRYCPIHIGLLDFNIIASDTILLIISISTTFALSMTIRVSNEAKFFQEVKFLGFMRCFSVKIEKSSKMSKIQPKTCKKYHIFENFLILTQENTAKLHAISDYKKRLYKKRPVEFKETKKRRLVTIYKAKKRNSKKCL